MSLAQELHRDLWKQINQMELLRLTKRINPCLLPLYKQAEHPPQSHSPSACLQQDIPVPWAFQACGKGFDMQDLIHHLNHKQTKKLISLFLFPRSKMTLI